LRNVAERDAVDDSLDDSLHTAPLDPKAFAGVVETALAKGLQLAADAQRWEIVAQLAEELATLRSARGERRRSEPRTGHLVTRRGAR